MSSTALIAPPASAAAPRPGARPPDSGDLIAGLPPLLSFVPEAGPPALAYLGFGVVLLLLLVPPFTLLATLLAVALAVAAAFAALLVVAVAILQAPLLLVGFLRDHRPTHFALPVPHVRAVKTRRV